MGVPIILFSLLTADIFLLKRKKIIWATPFFLLSLPLIWCFPACQELSSLYHFFIYSWQIAVGYNYSMFLSESSPLWFLIFAGGAFFVFILSFFTDTKQKTYDSAIEKFLYSTLVLPNLFVICKYGVVRADVQHIYFALQYLALTAVFCSMYFCGMHGKWRFCLFSLSLLLMLVSIKIQGALFYRMEYYATVSAVFAAILLIFVLLKYDFFTVLSRSILLLFLSIGIVLLLYSICLPWKSQWKGAVVRQQKALLFSDITTRPLKTADYFSFEILPFIDKAKYRPRMVIQSYSAYTPMLLRKNASCFEYASGPDLIYYDRQAIDSILPSFHDSLALLHIINNYEVGPYKKQLRKKSICPPKAHLREVKMFCSEMNKIIHLPQQKQFLWMSIDFQCTLIGKILKYALRPSEVKIKLVLDNGKKLVHKIIPENAIVPFLISPYMSEWDQLGNLLDKNNAALPKVVSCSVYPVFHCFSHYFDLENWDSKIGELSYHKTITVRFFQQEHFVEKTESHL